MPRNIVDVYEYTKLLCNRDQVPMPEVQVRPLPQGMLGMYQAPNSITFWTNPTYELIVAHEYLHYLGFIHDGNPTKYIQEIYFMEKKRWFFLKRKPKHYHSYCGYCVGNSD